MVGCVHRLHRIHRKGSSSAYAKLCIIMLEVARQSGGQYKMGPGTLYDNIKKLLKLGLVEESPAKVSGSEARRKYHLTQIGSSVLAAETERLAGVLREARRGLRLHEERQS
jgi:DNA-binding PadR family transcriptional regulator